MDIVAVAPWAVACATGAWAVYLHFHGVRKDERNEAASVEIHRDDLVIKLLAAAREEVAEGRAEVEEVRQENKTLRAIEQHFYHFEQALEHLEAILSADDPDARAVAEKNARAFLLRMRRLQQAKGNIQQEIQIVESASRLERKGKP